MTFIKKIKKKIHGWIYPKTFSISSAREHNSLGNVDRLNSNKQHWLTALKSDAKFIETIMPKLEELCSINDDMKVADYGCGTGVLVNSLKSKYKNIDIKGYDFSSKKIEMCRAFYTDIPASTFEANSIYDPNPIKFDLIIATEVLEHLEYPRSALLNLVNMADEQGAIFLSVPDGRKDTFEGHIHFWSPESWELFLEDALDNTVDFSTGQVAGKNFAHIKKK